MTTAAIRTRKLTFEELLQMEFPEDGAKRELVNGEIVVTPAPNMAHKDVQSFLHELFTAFKLRHPHYRAYSELNLKLSNGDYVIPDFVIVRLAEHGGPCRKMPQYIEGPPDVVVEVLSPDRQWRDTVEKRGDYERDGIPEYWIFDPSQQKSLFLRLDGGRYSEVPAGRPGVYECASVPGLRLDVSALFRGDLEAGVAVLTPTEKPDQS